MAMNVQKPNALDRYRTQAQSQLAKQRRNAQLSADASMQKLMKYLPQQTKGYSIGMTETAKIAANNSYMRQLAQADMDYAEKSMELDNYVRQEQERLDDKEYQRRWNEDEREYNRGRDTEMDNRYYEERDYNRQWNEDEREYNRGRDTEMDNRYYEERDYNRQWNEDEREYNRGRDAQADQQAEQNALFNEIKGVIEGGAWNTGDELMKYVKSFEDKDGLSADQYNLLMQYASSIANNPDQQAADAVIEANKAEGNTAKTVTGSAVWYDDDSGFLGLFGTADEQGDNIEVQIPGADNEDLNVQYDQKIEGENATSITNAFKADNGREPKDGEVFGYDKKIYVYKNGVLWSLTGRGGSTATGDYGELYRHYFG